MFLIPISEVLRFFFLWRTLICRSLSHSLQICSLGRACHGVIWQRWNLCRCKCPRSRVKKELLDDHNLKTNEIKHIYGRWRQSFLTNAPFILCISAKSMPSLFPRVPWKFHVQKRLYSIVQCLKFVKWAPFKFSIFDPSFIWLFICVIPKIAYFEMINFRGTVISKYLQLSKFNSISTYYFIKKS